MGCRLPAAGFPLAVAPRLFRPRGAPVRCVVSCVGGGGSSGEGAIRSGTGRCFGWDNVFRMSSEDREGGPSGLGGYFERVRSCNRGSVRLSRYCFLTLP